MPHMSKTFGRWPGEGARLLAGAFVALVVQACGGGGGGGTPAPVDHARLDVCVLAGANVADGCTTSGTDPQIQLGDLEMGQTKSRVVALYDGGDGDVAATVSALAFAPAQGANYTLSVFKLENGVETPATLPFDLRPNHATELRVRVQFTANVAIGAVSGVSLAVTASHPAAGGASVAIVGNVTGCPAGRGDCDADPSNACETDLLTTLAHCGGCGTACDATHGTPSCSGGVCGIACDPGFGNCDLAVGNGCETNFATDAANCGACAAACSAANGTPSCTASACSIACTPGFADCDGSVGTGCETNLATDLLHCGACATACGTANGTPTCAASACSIACNPGYADCDGVNANGCETVLATDLAHCGTCGNACSSTNGTPSCTAGTCSITCSPGFADCDANVANGCEANLGTDPLHCSACGTACNSTNGTATCSAGVCGITCNPGFADCDGNPANGCEVNLNADPTHCGTCGTACNGTNGTATCSAGVCGITCNPGYGDCDGLASTGCEVNLNADTTHCGTCGTVCNATNGTASCSAGVCGITCNSGYGDCDGLASTGCEVNLNTDTTHCGACVVACSTNNGAPSCTAGLCGISCFPGFADCNASVADGCEANLVTDPAHCGACVNACNSTNGTATCAGSTCGITCSAGWANCDGLLANGCEVNVLSDPANCSACGAACAATNGTPFCDTGACGITCNVGFGNCDASAATGCETNLTIDPANCNACGNVCPPPANGVPGCLGGTCGIAACNPGYADCDTLPGDGCEVNITADPANCGACGAACIAANVATPKCVGSTCAISTCAGGWTDYDGLFADGCECKTQIGTPVCASAYSLGSLNPGQSIATPLDGIVGVDSYWTVSFPGSGPGAGTPTISFAENNGLAVFDVLTACGGSAYACGNGGVATERTVYQFVDNASYPGYGYWSRNTAWPSTVIIRVHQKAATTGCPMYRLLVSR